VNPRRYVRWAEDGTQILDTSLNEVIPFTSWDEVTRILAEDSDSEIHRMPYITHSIEQARALRGII